MHVSDMDLLKKRLYYKYLRDQESYQDKEEDEGKTEKEFVVNDSSRKKEKVATYVCK
jgi:hypothetical protein